MKTIAGVPLVLGEGVEEFIKAKGIEEGFAILCALANECISGLIHMRVELWDDVDEEGRQSLVVMSFVPMDYPVTRVLSEEKILASLRVERIPWSAAQYLSHLIRHTKR